VMSFTNTPCIMTIDDKESFKIDDLTNVFASVGDIIAGYYVLPGNSHFCQKNKDLGIAVAHGMKGLRRLRMLMRASNGNHVGMRGIWLSRGRKITIESEERSLVWTAEGEVFNEEGMKVVVERVDDAIKVVVPKEREYSFDYDESIYYQEFEDSFKERQIDRIE